MTTTTTFQGISPNGKSSSRVLRPPGGESSFSLGTDENTTPQRKNKMASNIFAEPEDPHAHRRNNPPTWLGTPAGGRAEAEEGGGRRRKAEEGGRGSLQDCPGDAEQEDQEPQQEKPQPSEPSGAANGATGGRRNPPGGKSSLILG
uniref:Jupiter microtubule associated homolog 1b n=1 Tax=Tetraodon nigroviridis TaxID=99883 RepID=H3C5G5_TETNG